jgi:hypothetical protein
MASALLNEQGWPPDVIERQLAHAERNEVRRAYNRAKYLPERLNLSTRRRRNGRFEGAIIAQTLNLYGKRCKYEYVRTKKAFEAAVKRFGRSRYRYQHISSHGDSEGMCTTNLEDIDFDVLGDFSAHTCKVAGYFFQLAR